MTQKPADTDYRIREVHAALDRRIEVLERHVRQRRAFSAIGLLAALSAFGVASFALNQIRGAYFTGEVASTLEAQALVLRDSEGIERGALRVGQDGTVSLSLRDGDANPRVRMSVLEDGSPGVSLLDGNGDTRAILGFLPDGTTTLVFADEASVARAVLALTPDGASRMIFSDHAGETRAAIGVDGVGRPDVNTVGGMEGG
jgi:hypothetical protein